MTTLEIGQEVDRYVVEGILGKGGAATVYAVRHQRLNSLHALKVMSVSTGTYRKRLLQEGRGQAGLRHPNVVSVFDVLDINGAPALLMEYVAGPTLGRFLKRNRLTEGQALWLFRGIVLGVGAAHRRGLVHRDLKPDNVLLAPTNDGLVPKVTDFGLVKQVGAADGVTRTGVAVGTAPYMAPEQIVDASVVDQRVDMWALGCVLYELICRRRAFSGPDVLSIFNRVRKGDYRPADDLVPGLTPTVSQAIRGLLAVDPDERIGSCDELFELLFDRGPAPERIDMDDFPADREPAPVLLTQETTLPTDILRTRVPRPTGETPIALAPLVPEPDEALPPGVVATLSSRAHPAPPARRTSRWSPPSPTTTFAVSVTVAAVLLALAVFAVHRRHPAPDTGPVARTHLAPSPSIRQGEGP